MVKDPIDFFCFKYPHTCGNKFRNEFIEASKRHGIKNVSFIGETKSLLLQALTLFSHTLQNNDVFWIIKHEFGTMFCFVWKYDETNGWIFKAHYLQEKSRAGNPYKKQQILTEDLQRLKNQIKETEIVPFLFVFTSLEIEKSSEKKFSKVFPCKDFLFYRNKEIIRAINSSLKYARCLSGEKEFKKYKSSEIIEGLFEVKMDEKVIIKTKPFCVLPFVESLVIGNTGCNSLKIYVNNEHTETIPLKIKGMCEIKLTIDLFGLYNVTVNSPFKNKSQPLPVLANSYSTMFGNPSFILENDESVPETGGLLNFEVDKTDSATLTNLYVEGEVYRNFTTPKGLALIINNRIFDKQDERHGTEIDGKNIRQLLTKLGYKVEDTRHNLSADMMIRAAVRFANMKNQKFYDSCAVVVLTHGKYDYLCVSDGSLVNVHQFMQCFNSTNAPLLGKPKLFFLQACRGSSQDPGIDATDTGSVNVVKLETSSLSEYQISTSSMPLQSLTETDSQNLSNNAEKQPTEADMLVAFATTPQYVSWRNTSEGSWFIQSICEIFSEHSKNEDICSLLTRVNRRVAQVYQSSENKRKQIPEFVNRLQKRFYFFPGIQQD
uniref:Caspase-8 n=1 Tax=Panagrolaimus sp. ES5 TaxID=591445 RepID=A0AC34F3T3_9BILA